MKYGFDKIFKVLKLLNSIDNISLVVATTVINSEFINAFDFLCEKLKPLNIRWDIKRVSYSGRATDISKDYLTNKEWNNIVDYVENKKCTFIRIFKTFDFSFLDSLDKDILVGFEKKVVKNCGSGVQKIYIYPNMDVLACTCYEGFPSGNLNENSLKDILLSDNHNFLINQKVDNEVCSTCDYIKICNGGCMGSGYSMLEKHNIPDVKCPKIYNRLNL